MLMLAERSSLKDNNEAADRRGVSLGFFALGFFVAAGLCLYLPFNLICERYPAVRHAGIYGPQFLAGFRSSLVGAVLRSLSAFGCFNHRGTLTTLQSALSTGDSLRRVGVGSLFHIGHKVKYWSVRKEEAAN
jgi:hypothetical protein